MKKRAFRPRATEPPDYPTVGALHQYGLARRSLLTGVGAALLGGVGASACGFVAGTRTLDDSSGPRDAGPPDAPGARQPNDAGWTYDASQHGPSDLGLPTDARTPPDASSPRDRDSVDSSCSLPGGTDGGIPADARPRDARPPRDATKEPIDSGSTSSTCPNRPPVDSGWTGLDRSAGLPDGGQHPDLGRPRDSGPGGARPDRGTRPTDGGPRDQRTHNDDIGLLGVPSDSSSPRPDRRAPPDGARPVLADAGIGVGDAWSRDGSRPVDSGFREVVDTGAPSDGGRYGVDLAGLGVHDIGRPRQDRGNADDASIDSGTGRRPADSGRRDR